MEFIIIGAIVLIGAYIYKNRPINDIVIPTPTVLRTDLLYGYYGTMDNQVAETKDHINILWESMFQGEDKAISNILEAKMPTVLDVASYSMKKVEATGRNYHYRDDCETVLRQLFVKMQSAGALQYVKAIYPMDEPNTNTTAEDLQKAITSIKKVASEFPDLTGVKFMCIYAAKPETYECIDQFDILGVDDYEEKSRIFTSNGAYTKLKAKLRPDQKTIVIPGGAFGQDPTPFVNFAHENMEVMGVVPFVWFGPMQPADKWVGIGDNANPLKPDYIAVGKKLTGK